MKFRVIFILFYGLFLFVNIGFCTPGKLSGEQVLTLSLEQAITLAQQQNRGLISSSNTVETSRLSLKDAWSDFDVKWAPSTSAGITDGDSSVDAGITLKRKLHYGTTLSLTPGIGKTSGEYSGSVSLGLTMPLLKGFGTDTNLSDVKSSEFNLRTSLRNDYITRVNAVLAAVYYFYKLLELKDLVGLYGAQVTSMKAYAAGSKVKKSAGLATPMDVFRAEILLKDVEDDLALTLTLLSDAREDFKNLLSLPPDTVLDVKGERIVPPIEINLEDAIDSALSHRVEIEQGDDAIREAIRASEIAKDNLQPQLDLTVEYERYANSESFGGITDLDDDIFTINFVSTTDWARASEKIAYQKSLINVRNARINLDTQKDLVVNEVKQYYRALLQNQERMQIRKDQIDKAKGKLKLSQIKYKYEMADNFDVIESEKQIQDAQVNFYTAQTDYIVGMYRLEAAMGTLINKDRDQ
ncbi:MAG: TolC family protein [Desulfobacteraceae bacterium]|nr:MAG: TolC family protein [Desulfobacteraceae bacterium]